MLSTLIRNRIWFFGIALIVCAGVFLWQMKTASHALLPKSVELNGKVFVLEIAKTQGEREKGLGERDNLCDTCSMLFVFERDDWYAFWMKGMRFPLDIVWLKDDVVISLEHRIPADSSRVFLPENPVNRVLELNAGEADSLQRGNRIRFR